MVSGGQDEQGNEIAALNAELDHMQQRFDQLQGEYEKLQVEVSVVKKDSSMKSILIVAALIYSCAPPLHPSTPPRMNFSNCVA